MIIIELTCYLLLLLALFSFVQVLFAFLLLHMESTLNTHIKIPIVCKPNVASMIKSFLFEWLVKLGVRLISYPILFYRHYKHDAPVVSSKKCIVLLHGYSRNEVDWIWFKKHLQVEGDLVTPTLPLVKVDLLTSARALAGIIIKLSAQHGYNDFVLVGHSMGGVIASLAVESFDDVKEKVQKIVTIGSPFHGTKISTFGMGVAAEELLPSSKVLQELRDKIKVSSSDYYAIATNSDHMIVPWDSAITDNVKYKVVDGLGHMQMIYSDEVVNFVTKIISNDAQMDFKWG